MIYQHRIVIARGGKLERRHDAFQSVALTQLDDAGSVLVGAWEVYIGPEAGSAVWQLRQFESLARWADYQERLRADAAMPKTRQGNLYQINDEINTSILSLAHGSPRLCADWPSIDSVRGSPRGYIEQRRLRFRPGATSEHHSFYRDRVMPALEIEGAELIGLFDMVVGQGATTSTALQSIELRRFPDLASWQRWREAIDSDPALAKLAKQDWMGRIAEMHTELLRPLDYSRIR